jgi:hypothetical protein
MLPNLPVVGLLWEGLAARTPRIRGFSALPFGRGAGGPQPWCVPPTPLPILGDELDGSR